MTRRSKDIGTAAETALVRYLVENGWAMAERRALRGTKDTGDVTGTPGVVWEVKAGEAAKTASDGLILRWLQETETERAWDNAAIGVLVVARRQKNPRDWWAIFQLGPLSWLTTGYEPAPAVGSIVVRTTLADAAAILRHGGFGDPEVGQHD